ncbi:MAG: ABC transporter substrate-binding protein, partial [Pseudomonadota bacterium]
APDFEAIAALAPDLIIGLVSNDADHVDRLARIAPTVILDDGGNGLDLYRDIADVTGRIDRFEDLLADYRALVADARGWLGDHGHTYSKLGVRGGDLYVYGNFGALTIALNDLGFELIGDGVPLHARGATWDGEVLSPETLPDQDADFVFTTFRIDQGPEAGPTATLRAFEEVLPGFCDLMTACAKGRFVVLPLEHVALSFRTLDANVYYIVTNVAGRPGLAPPG